MKVPYSYSSPGMDRPLSPWHMVSVTPDLRLPSQPCCVTALWPVPNNVNNLPKVVTWQCPGPSRAIAKPGETFSRCPQPFLWDPSGEIFFEFFFLKWYILAYFIFLADGGAPNVAAYPLPHPLDGPAHMPGRICTFHTSWDTISILCHAFVSEHAESSTTLCDLGLDNSGALRWSLFTLSVTLTI